MRGKTKVASQALEQMLDNVLVPTIGQDRMYQTIDTYTSGTTQLYSFDPPKPFNPIGSMGSGFQTGSMGNIRKPLYENEDIKIQERYDFSGHNDSEPHYNLDYGKLTKGLLDTINNSNKFSVDEKKDLLSDLHFKNLFDKD